MPISERIAESGTRLPKWVDTYALVDTLYEVTFTVCTFRFFLVQPIVHETRGVDNSKTEQKTGFLSDPRVLRSLLPHPTYLLLRRPR